MRDMIIFKTKKRLLLKACTVLALAALVFILPPAACLAETVDVTRQVSLTVKPAGGGEQDKNEFSDDIGNAHIVIDLYKVADAKKVSGYDTYDFSVKEPYKGLFEKDDADIKKMTNEQWRKAGQEAAAIALGTAPEAQAQTPDVKGAGIDTKMSDLGAGLYLVIARGSTISSNEYIKTSEDGRIYTVANSDQYTYSFEPELVALPSREADETGRINTANKGDWIYDVVIYLKAAVELSDNSEGTTESNGTTTESDGTTRRSGNTTRTTVVKTGDDNNMLPYFLVAGAGGLFLLFFALFCILGSRNKRKEGAGS